MMETSQFIMKQIYPLIKTRGKQRERDIPGLLRELQPDKPVDGTFNFLAYNVPNKDRMKMKTGRFLTRKLKLNSGFLTDEQIQYLASTINMHLYPDQSIRIVSGSDITDNYRNEVGGHSCMTEDCCSYTKLYENNPDRFQQITAYCGNDSARAIVHKLDNGKYLMDRIYSTCKALTDTLFDHARKNNWYYRASTQPGVNTISIDGHVVNEYQDMVVSNLIYRDGEVPYMDTLWKYHIEGERLTIFHEDANIDADGDLDSTDGNLGSNTCCYSCDDRIDEDDICWAEDNIYCEYCFNEYFSYCQRCDETCRSDDMVSIDNGGLYVCECCAENSYYRCERCDEYFSDIYHVEDADIEVCKSCSEEYERCDDCGELFETVEDGYCEGCKPEEESEAA